MRIVSFIGGIILLGIMCYLGYYTYHNSNFVIWFGLIMAVVSPLTLELILFPLRYKDKKTLKDLSKVTEIKVLLEKAKESELKVNQLKYQIQELDKLIIYESKKKSLYAERSLYIGQAENALSKIKEINKGIELLTTEKQDLPENLKEILEIIEEIDPVDLYCIIGNKTITFKKKYFDYFPFYGDWIYRLFKQYIELTNQFKKRKEKKK